MRKLYFVIEVPYSPRLLEGIVERIRSLPILVRMYYVSSSEHAWEVAQGAKLDGTLTPVELLEKVKHSETPGHL